MPINDSNKTDQFDNELSQLVHNDVAYQGATEITVASVSNKLTDGTQKSQITDGTNIAWITASVASQGSMGLVVRPIPYHPASYSASAGFVAAATPTDVFNIIGSASKVIRIKKLRLTGTTTSGSPISVNVGLIKRTSLNTGGTRVTLTSVSHDNTNPTATASVGNYTANPTALGTSAGAIRTQRTSFNVSGLTGGQAIFEFSDGQPFILRGATEQLCVNFNATSITGNQIAISIEWEEI